MNNTFTKIAIGIVTVVSGGAYVPIIPNDLQPGLTEYPEMKGYQYAVGSDRTMWKLVNGEFIQTGVSPDADFTDDDKNGLISVAVFTNKKGQDVYKKITEEEYRLMGVPEGYKNNPKRAELVPLFEKIIPQAEAAIAIDSSSDGYANATSLTFSLTVTGSNTAIAVSAWTFPNGDVITGVTYNAEALTKKGTKSSDAGGFQNVWGAAGADTGTHNVVVSASPSSQLFVAAASYTGVDQTTPFPATAVTGGSSADTFSASITTTVDQSWLFLGGRSPSKVPTAGANTFLRETNAASGDAGWILDSNGARSTGSNSLAWSYTGASFSYWVLIDIAPAAAAVASPANQNFILFDE